MNLSNQDLGDMLDEAGRTDDPDAWDSKFASVYRGRSVLIDSIVIAAPDGTAGSSYDLALRIFPRGESRNRDGRPDRYGVFDLTGFRLFDGGPQVGSRVIFGAKLESFRYDDARDQWVVRLLPKSGVWITHTKALESLEWQSDSVPLPTQLMDGGP